MDKALGVFWYLKDRLAEPGSKAAIASVLAMVGVKIDPGAIQDVINFLTVIFGAMAFFQKEAKPLGRQE